MIFKIKCDKMLALLVENKMRVKCDKMRQAWFCPAFVWQNGGRARQKAALAWLYFEKPLYGGLPQNILGNTGVHSLKASLLGGSKPHWAPKGQERQFDTSRILSHYIGPKIKYR
jgi:hypothetical protein